MLVCAMNPCRCGWYGHPIRPVHLHATRQVESYLQPHLRPPAGPHRSARGGAVGGVRGHAPQGAAGDLLGRSSSRVNAARQVQQRRYEGTGVTCNAYMTPAMIGQYCRLDAAGEKLMQGAFDRLGLTGRSHDRILRVARTIADLEGEEQHRSRPIWRRPSSTAAAPC